MEKYFFLRLTAALASLLLIIPVCRQQPQTRQYEEKAASSAPLPNRPQGRPNVESWRWEKPRQWREEESSGLRLAAFSIPGREGSSECTLIPLPGDGGGVRANVQRWLEQLQLPAFSPPDLEDFLARQKKIFTGSGLPVMIIDFTALSPSPNRLAPSLLIAIIQAENQTLFVKMSGGKARLGENRGIFFKFCQSLSLGA
jgi:hypothetical protein